MKLKVACSSCSRVHLITLVEEKVAPIMELTCLSCGSTVKYRIAVVKEGESAEDKLKKLFGDYNRKTGGGDVFSEFFGVGGNKK